MQFPSWLEASVQSRQQHFCALLQRLYGRIPEFEALAVLLELAERTAGCACLAKHLAGSNAVADAGSRSSVFAGLWNTDVFKDAMLRGDFFATVNRDLGPFDVDLFADREGLNA